MQRRHTSAKEKIITILLFSVAQAQNLSFSIEKVAAPSTVDLSRSIGNTTGDSFTWSMNMPVFRETPFDTSLELLSGSPDSSDAIVVDIIACNFSTAAGTHYLFPTNLQQGQYFVRVNATVQGFEADGHRNNQFLSHSANSNVINVISSNNPPIGCGSGKTPSSWAAVPSNTTSEFTSFQLWQPQPGTNVIIDSQNSTTGSITVAWHWRNGGNFLDQGFFNGGISNFTVTLLNSDGSKTIGSPLPVEMDENLNTVGLKFADYPVKAGESYKVMVTYNNVIQDGVVPPGGLVKFTSEEFNVVDTKTNCNTGGSSGQSGGKGGGDDSQKGAALSRYPCIISVLLAFGACVLQRYL